MAFVVLPRASATIGSIDGPGSGIRTGRLPSDYWVFAGFTMRGRGGAMGLWGSNGWRIVANDISCPNGDGAAACLGLTESSSARILGNNIHDTGKANASALYHGVYLGTDSNHVDFGWNNVANVHGCRGLQVHSSPQSGEPNSGQNQYDISIHDNVIRDTQCDGVILDTIDPSRGPIRLFNNVIFNAGKGPNNPERTGGWSCINVPGHTERGAAGGGVVEVYNNTLYGCGTFVTPPYDSENAAITYNGGNSHVYIRLRNNIIYQISTSRHARGVPYLLIWKPGAVGALCSDRDDCAWIQGSNNLFFGSGTAPRNPNIVSSLNTDPAFTDISRYDFHLQPSSPARGRGVDTSLVTDADGHPRGGSEGIDVGAYQFHE